MSFKLDKKQEELKVRIAERENGENHGGIITTTTATNDLRIRQVLIEHILPQKSLHKPEESQANRTLIIGSPSWIKKFKEPLENITKSSKSSVIFFNDSRRSPKLASLAGKDIVLINYSLLETIKSWTVSWERIIFHDFPDKNDKNDEQFQELCQLEATFRWCLTENHKQLRLAEFLIADGDKRETFIKDAEKFLEQANLILLSEEPKSRKLKTPLNDRQKDFKKSLAQREKEPLTGGIVTILIRDIPIKETIIAFLLDQKNTSEEDGHLMGKTLLVVPTIDAMESWKKLIKSLLEKDDLSIDYFDGNETKKPENSYEVLVTTYVMLETIENLKILWKRIIFEDNYSASEKDRQQNQLHYPFLCQLHAEYRWCLTENPTQHKLARFMNREEYGESHNLIKSVTSGNAKEGEKKSTAKLVKNIEGFLKQVTLPFPRSSNDYEKHITNAKKEKNENEPNIRKFCNNMLAAIVSYTEEFYIKHFNIPTGSDEDIEEMYDSFCAGLINPLDVNSIMKVWMDAHWNFSKSEQDRCFIGKKPMESIIKNFEEAIEIIEKATQTSIEESYNQMRAARNGKRQIEEDEASNA